MDANIKCLSYLQFLIEHQETCVREHCARCVVLEEIAFALQKRILSEASGPVIATQKTVASETASSFG